MANRWGENGNCDRFYFQFSSVAQLFLTLCNPMDCSTLCITNSQSLLKLMSIESVMPSNHVILCRPLLLLPSVLPNIRVFSSESVLCIRWPSIGASILELPAAAAAKSLQCPTLCDPIDGSPLGSSVPGILQAGTLEWVAISFSNA